MKKNIISTSVLCLVAFTGTFAADRGYLDGPAPAPVRPQHEAPMPVHPEKEPAEPDTMPASWTKPVTISVRRPTAARKIECKVRDLTQGSGQVRICDEEGK